MVAGDQIWRQVKQGPHREHFPALWRALPFVLPPIPPQRSRSFPGLTMRSQVLQSAIFSCIMQTAYRFVGVELRFRHPASRKHGGCDADPISCSFSFFWILFFTIILYLFFSVKLAGEWESDFWYTKNC